MNDVRKIEKEKSTGNANVETWTIGDVYHNRGAIVAHPEQYGQEITQFAAGGLSVYSYRNISIAELALCWQHAEFRYKCPECGHVAFIYNFAGRVNNGGYWEICAYCPDCDCGYSISHPQGLPHWTVLKDIFKEIKQSTDSNISK